MEPISHFPIIISPELKEFLIQFAHNSQVASLLLKEDHPIEDLIENPVNFISLANGEPTKISYITQERIDQSIQKNLDPWTNHKLRFQAKPGSFVNKIFKNIPSKEIENFSTLWRLFATQVKFNFSIQSGMQMKRWYYQDNYREQRGTLGNSCMKHEKCQDYLSMYTENTDVIKMIVMTDPENDYLLGRALLWELDGVKIMDRVYTLNDEEYLHHFKVWADKNGYIYKFEQKWNNSVWFESFGKKKQLNLSVKLKNYVFDRYPYLDTFKFVDFTTGELFNYKPEGKNIRTLTGSDGKFYGSDYLDQDQLDGLYYIHHEIVSLKYKNNLKVHNSKVVYSDINGGMPLLKEDSIHIEQIGDWVLKKEFNQFNNDLEIKRRIESWKKHVIKDMSTKKVVQDMILAIRDYIPSDIFSIASEELNQLV